MVSSSKAEKRETSSRWRMSVVSLERCSSLRWTPNARIVGSNPGCPLQPSVVRKLEQIIVDQ